MTNIDFSKFLPVNADPYFGSTNKTPYSANFMFSVQRELAPNMVVTASYVGTRGHNMLVLQQTNPGDPALCLSVSQPSQVAPGSATCGPFGENGVYTRADGTVINGTRTALGADYGTVTKQTSIGYSRYNGLELNLRYAKGPASVLAGYTYSKSVDVSSNLGEQVNPFDVALSEAPSAYDMRHNFVVSYNYELPFERLFGTSNQLTSGWSLVGHDAVDQRIPGDALQPDGHVAARHVRQRRQQQPARHAELHAGLRSARSITIRRRGRRSTPRASACRRSASSATRRAGSSTGRASRTSTSR